MLANEAPNQTFTSRSPGQAHKRQRATCLLLETWPLLECPTFELVPDIKTCHRLSCPARPSRLKWAHLSCVSPWGPLSMAVPVQVHWASPADVTGTLSLELLLFWLDPGSVSHEPTHVHYQHAQT